MRGPKIQDYEGQLSDLEREWTSIQTNIDRSAGLESEIDTLESGLGELRGRLMNVEQVAANYEFFYDLERRSGINLRQFSQGQPGNGESLRLGKDELVHFSVLPYDINMNGSIRQILNFMDLLDRQEYIIRFDLLNVSVPKSNTEIEITSDTQLAAKLRCYVLASKHE